MTTTHSKFQQFCTYNFIHHLLLPGCLFSTSFALLNTCCTSLLTTFTNLLIFCTIQFRFLTANSNESDFNCCISFMSNQIDSFFSPYKTSFFVPCARPFLKSHSIHTWLQTICLLFCCFRSVILLPCAM